MYKRQNLDLEYPQTASQRDAAWIFTRGLRVALDGTNSRNWTTHLSFDVGRDNWMSAPHGQVTPLQAVNGVTHWFGLMSYGGGSVNSFDSLKRFAEEFQAKSSAWPQYNLKKRMVIGLPFNGNTRNLGDICYSSLVKGIENLSPRTDVVTYKDEPFAINGADTISKKVAWAKSQGYAGVMTWHWGCDFVPSDPRSRTGAISRALRASK